MDGSIQGEMLKCRQIPSITAVGPVVTETDLNERERERERERESWIHDVYLKNVTSKVLTKFSFDLIW